MVVEVCLLHSLSFLVKGCLPSQVEMMRLFRVARKLSFAFVLLSGEDDAFGVLHYLHKGRIVRISSLTLIIFSGEDVVFFFLCCSSHMRQGCWKPVSFSRYLLLKTLSLDGKLVSFSHYLFRRRGSSRRPLLPRIP
jgi:hypothetical protein